MKSKVQIIEAKLTPNQQVIMREIDELYIEGKGYFDESRSYFWYHLGFYVAFVITFIMDLYLPAGFAILVALFAFIQHLRFSGKAKKVAFKIMELETQLFEHALNEATKAFNKAINGDKE